MNKISLYKYLALNTIMVQHGEKYHYVRMLCIMHRSSA